MSDSTGDGSSTSAPGFAGARDLSNDAFKLYLVRKYAIQRNDVLGKFVYGEQLFNTIEDVLRHVADLDARVQRSADQADTEPASDGTRVIDQAVLALEVNSEVTEIGAPRKFHEAIATCFKKYFVFSGRASRSEYWNFILFIVLVNGAILLSAVSDAILSDRGVLSEEDFSVTTQVLLSVQTIFNLAIWIPQLAVGSRRLHDVGMSGWYQALPLLGGALSALYFFKGFIIALFFGVLLMLYPYVAFTLAPTKRGGNGGGESRLHSFWMASAIAVLVALAVWLVKMKISDSTSRASQPTRLQTSPDAGGKSAASKSSAVTPNEAATTVPDWAESGGIDSFSGEDNRKAVLISTNEEVVGFLRKSDDAAIYLFRSVSEHAGGIQFSEGTLPIGLKKSRVSDTGYKCFEGENLCDLQIRIDGGPIRKLALYADETDRNSVDIFVRGEQERNLIRDIRRAKSFELRLNFRQSTNIVQGTFKFVASQRLPPSGNLFDTTNAPASKSVVSSGGIQSTSPLKDELVQMFNLIKSVKDVCPTAEVLAKRVMNDGSDTFVDKDSQLVIKLERGARSSDVVMYQLRSTLRTSTNSTYRQNDTYSVLKSADVKELVSRFDPSRACSFRNALKIDGMFSCSVKDGWATCSWN